ncbi:hypothetical protein Aperf_G00000066279 [Anoplocephala perfoliata]
MGIAKNLTSFSIANYRLICFSSSLLRKANPNQCKDQILPELEALNLLAKNATVRAQFSPSLPKHLMQGLPITNNCPVDVQSSFLKALVREEKVIIRVLKENGDAPLVFVEPNPNSSSSNSSVRAKLLKLRTSIDDHMMGVKVKQATELIMKGYEVSISVRLPTQHFRQIDDSPALSKEQKLRIKKDLYESSIRRFTDAFRDCSSNKPKLTRSDDLKEFTLVLSPGQ